MAEYVMKENKSASRAMEVLGTIAFGGVALAAVNGGGLGGGCGNGLLGNLFGGNNQQCWSEKEVQLLRYIDRVAASQEVTAAVTPYQISEATCDVVRARKFIPANEVVYTQPNYNPYGGCGCGYGYGGCI